MSLPSSICLQGEYCVIPGNEVVTSSSPVEVNTPGFADQQTLKTSDNTTSKMTYQPIGVSYNNIPSEFELNRRARSLGLFLTREQSGLALVSKGPVSDDNGDKLPRQSLPGIRDLNGDITGVGQRNRFPKAVMLPKIPNIKHPHVMQREQTSCDLPVPVPLTSLLTPRSKTTLDASSYTGKKSKTGVSGDNWSGDNWSSRDENGQLLSNSSRLVISSKSKGTLLPSSGKYYYRKFPHVILDQDSGVVHQNERNRLNGHKTTVNKTGVSDTIRTTNELFNLTRSKTDMMAVEQLIARSANRLKSTSAVSGWLDGMTCNPKKLHQRKYTFV